MKSVESGKNISEKVNAELLDLIASILKVNKAILTDDLHYQAIQQWDSLCHINLMLALEKNYNVVIDAELVTSLTSILKIKDFIINHQQKDSKPVSTNASAKAPIYRGLNDVSYDNSAITYIDGKNGNLLHFGYSIQDLAEHSSFEELCYLLLNSKLPTQEELVAFSDNLKKRRTPTFKVLNVITCIKTLHPTDALRTIISALPAFNENQGQEDFYETSLNLIAQVPFIIAAHYRISQHKKIIFPDQELSHAANFLYMLKGELPTELEVKILNQDLILHAEHGSNASTFCARVTTGTQADVYAAVTAAIAAFSGGLHGGALEKVFSMLKEIETPANAAQYVKTRIENNLPIYGYGHRVYRKEDPRASQLRKAAHAISLATGEVKWLHILEEINTAMQPHAKLGININVDYYAAVIYHLLGIPQELFVATFIMSRIAGWLSHIQEQMKNNILIRPRLNYTGKNERTYMNIKKRV